MREKLKKKRLKTSVLFETNQPAPQCLAKRKKKITQANTWYLGTVCMNVPALFVKHRFSMSEDKLPHSVLTRIN